jgi:anthranilate synthase component 1
MLADVFTPVGIYLRLRDRFRDTILLESTDHHSSANSWSFICINAIGGMEIRSAETVEFKLPGRNPERVELKNKNEVPQLLWNYMQKFEVKKTETKEARFAQGRFGYLTYDAVLL